MSSSETLKRIKNTTTSLEIRDKIANDYLKSIFYSYKKDYHKIIVNGYPCVLLNIKLYHTLRNTRCY